ncbi:MAG: Uma2 family endonuclease [Cyanobacteria bacterium P01_A01_bin.114]
MSLMIFLTGYSIPQTDPPRSPREALPTMYDLPSEFPEEPGLPDEFHDLQPQLLSRTLHLKDCAADNRFTGSDLNLYYDGQHPLWHKRPDWFLALDVPRLYDGREPRRSYVVWQERYSPTVIIEFLSPRTEREDLGRFYESADQVEDGRLNNGPNGSPDTLLEAASGDDGVDKIAPPSKVVAYEKYLRVPHYLVYSRYTQRLRYFKLIGSRYEEQPVQAQAPMIWLSDLEIGLGLWDGYFEGLPGPWLRWCDAAGNWCLTDTEQERLAKEQTQERADRLAEKLRSLGVDPDQV